MIIEIENLKGIKKLSFEIPPPGLWLLTGINGSGKTSILAALYRIKYGRAFQDHYKTTATQEKLDTFKNSKVRYKINNKEVTYSYGGTRWPPTPRSNSSILDEFPFATIQFIQANKERVEPFSDEIIPKYIIQESVSICSFMAYVLDDSKWNNLKYVNTRRGNGNEAYLVPYEYGNQKHYYSEKNFSLGELCILKLAKSMYNINRNSMILIDEVEMALHPQAQIRLLKRIKEIALKLNLTVLFSTHSSSLIKNADRNKIIFICKDENGNHAVKTGVYPALVLGDMACDEELNCDFIFFVEDDQAKLFLESLYSKYKESVDKHHPVCKIVPVGGYTDVMKMLERSTVIIPSNIKKHVFLDDDVRTHSLPNFNAKETEFYERVKKDVSFLPCTPEVGVIDMVNNGLSNGKPHLIRVSYNGQDIVFREVIESSSYRGINGSTREIAKKKMTVIVNYIVTKAGADEVTIRRLLYSKYINFLYNENIGSLSTLFGPILNKR